MTFTFRPLPGGRIRADHATAAGEPHVWLSLTNTRGEHAAVFIPLANVEEVIAGLRDIARQAGAQSAPLPGAPITDEQYAHAAAVLPPAARIAAEAVRQAAQSTQDDFGLATGSPGPTATEGAGA